VLAIGGNRQNNPQISKSGLARCLTSLHGQPQLMLVFSTQPIIEIELIYEAMAILVFNIAVS
jgi:hypothetical protein